ncbi:MBL fold hydrolase [Streptomyces pluripotens]|uniref:MBL fold hydrolase n=1 Tax=Streptomyces pluripotens TaxID=1355015 RepID=A0A221NWS1_9ACTN|nr:MULTISPECIES: MBL fold metallo-hydrolase [Streptomyces]ARP70161.1 MBL fold hydrolase [Streptomyces pluripotens]ASN24421.1 MBL fold hydrolase [Streptomyces pluripotens]KIE25177.1 metallo-beta-lactamase [Streptomyces sp. MUSC 125]MCH0559153.1 MBL fold metallo-hydrolase [Streptomyces sp. MUM 16J]
MTVTWEELGWERLAAGVGRCRLPGWDCTAGLVLGEGAALMVDAGSSLAEGARLRAGARKLSGGRVTHLALTHPHFDHVFGAPAFTEAEVYAAVGVDAVFAGGGRQLRVDAVGNGLPAEDADEAVAALTPPRHLVSGEWTLDLGGGRQVLLANVGPGHTAHDLAVCVPGPREVVFCGDLVEESGEPQAGPDAVPSRWPDALDRLLALGGEDALYVPGHGTVVDAGFVRRQRDALAARFGVS